MGSDAVQTGPSAQAIARGDALRKEGNLAEAVEAYRSACGEVPDGGLCLKIARCYQRLKDFAEAGRWAVAALESDDFATWQGAATLLGDPAVNAARPAGRSIKLAVLGSYTTTQLVALLRAAALKAGIRAEMYECAYGQYRQEILDPGSGLYAFEPDAVVLAVHEGEVALPEMAEAPSEAVAAEVERWTSLWSMLASRCRARIVQHNLALPAESPLGHLAARVAGSRYSMMAALNGALGAAAGTSVSVVDCERLSGLVGKLRWFDPRYWYLSKQAVSLETLPVLARHTAAVLAADLGLSRKCVVLDLDNTLWGGIIGEDGLAGIKVGNGVDGEAFVAFQEYLLKLKRKGLILAVCSKNNDADAREPFVKHPEMRLKLEDFAAFYANWSGKAENLQAIARELNIGIDALVFVDDNPAERQVIREMLPQVQVVALPADPCGYVRALGQCLSLETAALTAEDAQRTEQYRARAQLAALEKSAGSMEEFYRGLKMEAVVEPFNQRDLPRIAQLIGKTNQFNLTTRRHGISELRAFMAEERCVHFSLRLRDRFADHGLVGLMIGVARQGVLEIDTWLMSCRVIGRTVEAEMLQQLCQRAAALGCTAIKGVYIPTAKNAMVKDVFGRFGFVPAGEDNGTTFWMYDLEKQGPVRNEYIAVLEPQMDTDEHRSEGTEARRHVGT